MTVSPRALAAAGLNAGAGVMLAGAVACDVRAGAVACDVRAGAVADGWPSNAAAEAGVGWTVPIVIGAPVAELSHSLISAY